MSYNSTKMYICECGNVFDDYETYEDMPRFGKTKKPLVDRNGEEVIDRNGHVVHMKCHKCRRTNPLYRSGVSRSSVGLMMDFLREHDYVTSNMHEQFGFHSRHSMTSSLHSYMKKGIISRLEDGGRPQKYKLAEGTPS